MPFKNIGKPNIHKGLKTGFRPMAELNTSGSPATGRVSRKSGRAAAANPVKAHRPAVGPGRKTKARKMY